MSLSIRPGPALITRTRSASSAASSTEWVTKIMVTRVRAQIAQQLALELLARERVERAERLIHQEDIGVVCQHAGNGDPLLHAARKLVGITAGGALEPDELHELVGNALNLAARQPALARAETDVLANGHPGKQRVVLKHHAAVAARTGDPLGVHQNLAGGRLLEPGDDAQHSRLAAARGADQTDELTLLDCHIDAGERFDFAIAHCKPLAHAPEHDVMSCLMHGAGDSIAGGDC